MVIECEARANDSPGVPWRQMAGCEAADGGISDGKRRRVQLRSWRQNSSVGAGSELVSANGGVWPA